MTATVTIAAHVADRVALADGWLLWRDFAVRSAGFPIDGLSVFGPGDESARLRVVAREAAFREAMTWQNTAAVANALDKIGDAAGSSKARRREDVVASYWQRYCAKNDTIGFYGPLAWGRVADSPSSALHAHNGSLIRDRSVHLESWGVQTLATASNRGCASRSGRARKTTCESCSRNTRTRRCERAGWRRWRRSRMRSPGSCARTASSSPLRSPPSTRRSRA